MDSSSPSLLTVGFYKGEMDFGISGEVAILTVAEMHDFRGAICVAIAQAEALWSRAQEQKFPASKNI